MGKLTEWKTYPTAKAARGKIQEEGGGGGRVVAPPPESGLIIELFGCRSLIRKGAFIDKLINQSHIFVESDYS